LPNREGVIFETSLYNSSSPVLSSSAPAISSFSSLFSRFLIVSRQAEGLEKRDFIRIVLNKWASPERYLSILLNSSPIKKSKHSSSSSRASASIF